MPIPGGVPELQGCGTEGHSQWAWWEWVGLDDLRGLANLNDSKFL